MFPFVLVLLITVNLGWTASEQELVEKLHNLTQMLADVERMVKHESIAEKKKQGIELYKSVTEEILATKKDIVELRLSALDSAIQNDQIALSELEKQNHLVANQPQNQSISPSVSSDQIRMVLHPVTLEYELARISESHGNKNEVSAVLLKGGERITLDRELVLNSEITIFQIENQIKEAQGRLISHQLEKAKLLGKDPMGSKISESECRQVSFDHLARIGPPKNQGNAGNCWAHAVSALIEEQLCLTKPSYCGRNVSRAQVIVDSKEGLSEFSKKFDDGSVDLGDTMERLLKRSNSICWDEHAPNPYESGHDIILSHLSDLFRNCSSQKSQVSSNAILLEKNVREILEFLNRSTHTSAASNNSLIALVSESSTENDFISKVLLSRCNKSERTSFLREGTPLIVNNHEFRDSHYNPITDKGNYQLMNLKPMLRTLLDAKQKNSSIAIGVCFNGLVKAIWKNYKMPPDDPCGRHAMVIDGAKWEGDRCWIHIRNSHGENAAINNTWYGAAEILSFTFGAHYFSQSPSH